MLFVCLFGFSDQPEANVPRGRVGNKKTRTVFHVSNSWGKGETICLTAHVRGHGPELTFMSPVEQSVYF